MTPGSIVGGRLIESSVGLGWAAGSVAGDCVLGRPQRFLGLGFAAEAAVVLVVDGGAGFGKVLAVTTGRGSQGVQLGGELGLGLDERATVVAHGLVTSVGILGEEGVAGGYENHNKKNESKGSVIDEEDDTHDTSNQALDERISFTVELSSSWIVR